MLLLENLKRTLWLMGHPMRNSAAFSRPCMCVGLMSSKPSPSKCSPQRIEELSVKDFVPPTFLPSFSHLILQTTLARRNGSKTALGQPLPLKVTFTVPPYLPPSYTSKTGPVDWLKPPTAGEQQRSLCKRNCCVGLTSSMIVHIKFPSSSV